MDRIEAFKLYFGIKLSFLNGYDFIKYGTPKKWDTYVMKRNDVKLIDYLIDKTGTPRKLLRLCVGNFLYSNDNFLYNEAFTSENFKRHLSYMDSRAARLQEDLDILEIRHYNFENIEKYLSSQDAINDILSFKIRIESFCLISQYIPQFLPNAGYLSEKVRERITRGQQFIPHNDITQEVLENSWLNTIVSSNNTIS